MIGNMVIGSIGTPPIFPPGSFYNIATVNASAQSSISFTSIPSTYKYLQMRFSLVETASTAWYVIQFNGDTSTASYTNHGVTAQSTAVAANGIGTGFNSGHYLTSQISNSATYPAVGVVDIMDYSSTAKYKTSRGFMGINQNTVNSGLEMNSSLWVSTAAISSIVLFNGAGTFTGAISLYGVN